MEVEGQVLGSRDVSSLVRDSLPDLARGQNAAAAYFGFDFAAEREQSAEDMLGALSNRFWVDLKRCREK